MSTKYRPSNGTEGDWFMSRFCNRCERQPTDPNDGGCEILGRTLFLDVTDTDYPAEWITDGDGPHCTAFVRRPTPGEAALEIVTPEPLASLPGQRRLFGATP